MQNTTIDADCPRMRLAQTYQRYVWKSDGGEANKSGKEYSRPHRRNQQLWRCLHQEFRSKNAVVLKTPAINTSLVPGYDHDYYANGKNRCLWKDVGTCTNKCWQPNLYQSATPEKANIKGGKANGISMVCSHAKTSKVVNNS